MIIGALMLFIDVQAQNANRNGVIVELGGGYTTGNIYEQEVVSSAEYYDYFFERWLTDNTYSLEQKGQGTYLSLEAGYQWATSRHFAVKAMASFGLPFSEAAYLNFGVKGMLRYTSRDFGNGQSIYAEAGIGAKMQPDSFRPEPSYLIIPDVGVGLNINSHLYIGLDFVYNIVFESSVKDFDYTYPVHDLSYGVPQLKVGYRF